MADTHQASAKNAPANSAIDRDLCSAGHKRCEHCCGTAFPFITDGTACHRPPGMAHPVPMTIGITDFPERPTRLEDRVKDNGGTGHITAVFQKGDQEVHYHYQRQESYPPAPTPPMIPSTSKAYRRGFAFSISPPTQPWKVSIQATSQSAIQVPRGRLGYVEYQENDRRENGDTDDLVGDDTVDLILEVFIFGKDLTFFHPALRSRLRTRKRFLSAASTAFLSFRSMSACT